MVSGFVNRKIKKMWPIKVKMLIISKGCNLQYYEICSKVNQVIYSSAPTSIPNIKAIAQIVFEISC